MWVTERSEINQLTLHLKDGVEGSLRLKQNIDELKIHVAESPFRPKRMHCAFITNQIVHTPRLYNRSCYVSRKSNIPEILLVGIHIYVHCIYVLYSSEGWLA